VALELSTLAPIGIIQTTALSIWMFQAPNRHIYDIVRLCRPGHALFPMVRGVVPAGLVPPELRDDFLVRAVPAQQLHQLPPGTGESDEARAPENWVETEIEVDLWDVD
jgi:hypothetical protein